MMTITREQVRDLQPGDVVELSFLHEYDASTITARGTFPAVIDWFENHEGGKYTFTVVSRVPRAFYVNHPRTQPWPGDVVRDAEREGPTVWMADRSGYWWLASMGTVRRKERHELPVRLILLVDGETGQVVP